MPSDTLAASSLFTRPLLGAVLLWAGLAKIRQGPTFARIIAKYAPVPDVVVRVLGRVIPLLEVILGGALIIGITPRHMMRGLADIR